MKIGTFNVCSAAAIALLTGGLRCLGLLTLAAVCLAACAVNPVTQRSEFVLMSEQQELGLGRKLDPEIKKQYGVYASAALQTYVSEVGQRVAGVSHRPDIIFQFAVLDSPVENAFALPGGYVYVTRGLLAYLNSEAELAGVLAHEVGHITARHAVRQYTKAASWQVGASVASVLAPDMANAYGQLGDIVFAAISSGYSREYETESDRLAVTYAVKAGYDAAAMMNVLKTLDLISREKNAGKAYTSLFATHPDPSQRIEEVLRELEGVQPRDPSRPGAVRAQLFLKQIDGLLFGSDVHDGTVEGGLFRHPDLRVECRFPESWPVENTPEAVVAADRDRGFQVALKVHRPGKRLSVEAAAKEILAGIGLEKLSGEKTAVHGVPAYLATCRGSSREAGPVSARAGFFILENRVFYILGFCRTESRREAFPFFEAAIRSFRQLSRSEADDIQPTMVRLYKSRGGRPLAGVLQALGRPAGEVRTVALLNGWEPGRPPVPAAGQVIKVLRNE